MTFKLIRCSLFLLKIFGLSDVSYPSSTLPVNAPDLQADAGASPQGWTVHPNFCPGTPEIRANPWSFRGWGEG
jgi:hypothetical protein